jgi:D-glycero-alpha-D-manno-heptose-7-phosphate kinase
LAVICREPIVVRAPLRISFAGGGTDLPAYYEQHGGCVLSTAIARYAYVIATPTTERVVRITSSDYARCAEYRPGDTIDLSSPLAHPLAAAEYFARNGFLTGGVDLLLASEVAPGTGLGSSSAMAVALIRALAAICNLPMSAREVAELACTLEIERLGMSIGKQDQYASAFGGLNRLTFSRTGVEVRPVVLPGAALRALQARLLLFSTGATHHSATLLEEQRANVRSDADVVRTMHEMKASVATLRAALIRGDLDAVGTLLDEGWQRKKRLAGGITNPRIDCLYSRARESGALGGKVTGAGGGGYLLLYCPPRYQSRLRAAMDELQAPELPFVFDGNGARVLTSEPGPLREPIPLVSERRRRGTAAVSG